MQCGNKSSSFHSTTDLQDGQIDGISIFASIDGFGCDTLIIFGMMSPDFNTVTLQPYVKPFFDYIINIIKCYI